MSSPRLAALAVLCATPALAQAPPASPPPPPLAAEAGLSYVQTGGNSDTQTVGLAVQALRWDPKWRVLGRAAFLRNEADDVVSAKKWSALLRGERALTERLAAYAESTFLRDVFAGIERENALDLGAAYDAVKDDRHLLVASLALAFTDESRTAPAEDRSFGGLRPGVGYRLKLRAGELLAAADWLQAFGDTGASRGRVNVAVASALSRLLALKVSHQLAYVKEPVPGKKKTDRELLASIVARWPPPAR